MKKTLDLQQLVNPTRQRFPLHSVGVAAAAFACAIAVQSGQVNLTYLLELLLNDIIK